MKKSDKDKAFQIGAKIINHIYPENSWKNDYTRLKWWFACSDQYTSLIKPKFEKLLREYKGKLWNRGLLLMLDYWLCWTFLGAEPDDYFDFEFFRKGWLWRNHHVTRSRLNFLIPIFNKEENIHLLIDKDKFYEHWNTFLKRKWCIPQNVTFEEFQSLFRGVSRILVKPTSQYGGKGIYALDIDSSNLESTFHQLHDSDQKIVVEEFVQQKGLLHDIYPTSLNTLRVCTTRITQQPEVCYAFFRTGCGGSIVDNVSSGGLKFTINIATGQIGVGHGTVTNRYQKHPDTGVQITGQYIPDWQKIKEFVCEAHRLAPDDLRMIGWDVCWNEGELSLIEGNDGPGFPELPDRHENQWKQMKEYLDRVYQVNGTK